MQIVNLIYTGFLGGLCVSSAFAGFKDAGLAQRFASKQADHGVLFVRLSDQKVLFESNPDQLLSPASVTKIITGAAALSQFGPAHTFSTPLYYTGTLKSGRISGDLIVEGSGDPFIISELLWQTAIDLRHKGIQSIEGDIIVDNSLFDDEGRDESRKDGAKKSTHAYDAPVSAFAVNFNTVAVAVSPTSKGQKAITATTPFPLRSVQLKGNVLTELGAADNGVALSRVTKPSGEIILNVSGRIGDEAPIKKIYRSVGDPSITAADYLRGFLNDAGIKVKGKVRVASLPASAKPLYNIQGYEMRRIVAGLNTFSNNFIADMLTKRLGVDPHNKSQRGTLMAGTNYLAKFLKDDVGIKGPFTLLNGSGLSTENRFSAKQMMQVLLWVEKEGDLFPDFLGGLPANGLDGTLKKRMKKSSDLTGLIRAKTGTLTDPITVAGMGGYFRHPDEGWVAFVMLSNGRIGKGQPGLIDLRSTQDDAIKAVFN